MIASMENNSLAASPTRRAPRPSGPRARSAHDRRERHDHLEPAGELERVRNGAIEILRQGEELLLRLAPEEYQRKSSLAFNGSIGGHFRHCLDHFTAIVRGLDHGSEIDYDARERDRRIEEEPACALQVSRRLRDRLVLLEPSDLRSEISTRCEVSYEKGDSPRTGSTVARELVYSIAHAIHHFALIAIIARIMEIDLPAHFGIAPSTLQHQHQQQQQLQQQHPAANPQAAPAAAPAS